MRWLILSFGMTNPGWEFITKYNGIISHLSSSNYYGIIKYLISPFISACQVIRELYNISDRRLFRFANISRHRPLIHIAKYHGINKYVESPHISAHRVSWIAKLSWHHQNIMVRQISRLADYHGSSSMIATMPKMAICRFSPCWLYMVPTQPIQAIRRWDNAQDGYMSIQPMPAIYINSARAGYTSM